MPSPVESPIAVAVFVMHYRASYWDDIDVESKVAEVWKRKLKGKYRIRKEEGMMSQP